MDQITRIPDLIKKARNGRNQQEFATVLGITQSTLSRYESGKSNPKAELIELCMRLVHEANNEKHPSADQLADRVRIALADPRMGQARSALAKLVDAFAVEQTQRTTAN